MKLNNNKLKLTKVLLQSELQSENRQSITIY